MRTTVRRALVAAGLPILGLFATSASVTAKRIESGNGVVCDSPQLVELFIALHTDTTKAIEQINAQSRSGTCEFLDASYVVGGIVGLTLQRQIGRDRFDMAVAQVHRVEIELQPDERWRGAEDQQHRDDRSEERRVGKEC